VCVYAWTHVSDTAQDVAVYRHPLSSAAAEILFDQPPSETALGKLMGDDAYVLKDDTSWVPNFTFLKICLLALNTHESDC